MSAERPYNMLDELEDKIKNTDGTKLKEALRKIEIDNPLPPAPKLEKVGPIRLPRLPKAARGLDHQAG